MRNNGPLNCPWSNILSGFTASFWGFFEIFVKTPYYRLIRTGRGKSRCSQVSIEWAKHRESDWSRLKVCSDSEQGPKTEMTWRNPSEWNRLLQFMRLKWACTFIYHIHIHPPGVWCKKIFTDFIWTQIRVKSHLTWKWRFKIDHKTVNIKHENAQFVSL